MDIVALTALGVGGATVIGAALGFVFKRMSHRFSDITLAFAAGIMLAAAVLGLIVPSVDYGIDLLGNPDSFLTKLFAVLITLAGIFVGAVCLNLMDRLVPHLHKLAGVEPESHGASNQNVGKILLFVMAIAIHNLPEGIAAGVGFGSGNTTEALLIAGGIALQNIPEGMVIIAPMLAAGIKPGKTFLIALGTGLVEVAGTFVGYFAANASQYVLPFALAFAGGTMLYIISDEMIPETHAHGCERGATYALLVGFCVMLVSSILLA